jgi:hypothetical protein
MSDIERENLDAHVSLCELRYQALDRRLEQVETQLAAVQSLLSEIRDSVAQLPGRQNREHIHRWEQFQWWLIGILVCSLGALISQHYL